MKTFSEIQFFKDLVIRDYSDLTPKEKYGKVEFYNSKKKRVATFTAAGKYAGRFIDWREGKSKNIYSYLMDTRGYSFKEAAQMVEEQTGVEYQPAIDWKTKKKQNELREQERKQALQQQINAHRNVSYLPLQAEAETYLTHVRGFQQIPLFVKNAVQYSPFDKAIIYPLRLFTGERVSEQRLPLTQEGQKNGIKKMSKGVIDNALWYAKGQENNEMIVLAEGVETAISIADCIHAKQGENVKYFDFASRMGTRIPSLPAQYKIVFLLVDNDKADSPAVKAAKQAIEYYREEGKIVIPLNCIGNEKHDFADLEVDERYIQFFMGVQEFLKTTHNDIQHPNITHARSLLQQAFNNVFSQNNDALVQVGMGIGKTRGVKTHIIQQAMQGKKIAFLLPNHSLITEKLPHLDKLAHKTGLKIAVYKGRHQPDMCQDLETVQQYEEAGQPAMIYCSKECPLAEICKINGYLKNLEDCAQSDILVATHNTLVQKMPKHFQRDVVVIDEYADGAVFTNPINIENNEQELDVDMFKKWVKGIPEPLQQLNQIIQITFDDFNKYFHTSPKNGINSQEITDAVKRTVYDLRHKPIQPLQNIVQECENKLAQLEGEKTYLKNMLPQNLSKLTTKQQNQYSEILKQYHHVCQKITQTTNRKIWHQNKIKEHNIQPLTEKELIQYLDDLYKTGAQKVFLTKQNITQYPNLFRFFNLVKTLINVMRLQIGRPEINHATLYKHDTGYTLTLYNSIHKSWGNPKVIILDATPLKGYERILKEGYETIHINADAPHTQINMIVQPFNTKTKYEHAIKKYKEHIEQGGNVYTQTLEPKSTSILELYTHIWSCNKDQPIGVVTTKALYDFMKNTTDLNLPPNTSLLYHGNIRGKNDLEHVSDLIILGTTLPPAEHFIRQYELATGEHVQNRDYIQKEITLYDQQGNTVTTKIATHENPAIAELIEHQQQAELTQAIERARTVNRTKNNPITVTIIGNVPLNNYPITHLIHHKDRDIYHAQRYNGYITGGADDIIIENSTLADKYFNGRIKISYNCKKVLETSHHIQQALNDGYTPYLLEWKAHKRYSCRVLLPPNISLEEAQEKLIEILTRHVKRIEFFTMERIELDMKVKNKLLYKYNKQLLSYMSSPLLARVYQNYVSKHGKTGLTFMEWFKRPDSERFNPDVIAEKRKNLLQAYLGVC